LISPLIRHKRSIFPPTRVPSTKSASGHVERRGQAGRRRQEPPGALRRVHLQAEAVHRQVHPGAALPCLGSREIPARTSPLRQIQRSRDAPGELSFDQEFKAECWFLSNIADY
jgi:hypothetical protein